MIDYASLGITPESVLSVTSWGFAFVVAQYLLGWGIGVVVDTIKKI